MQNLTHLFSPGKIGSVELKNRIVFAPMLDRLAGEDGNVSASSIAYYAERARGGAALLIVGAVYFTADSHYRPHQTGIYSDSLIGSHRALTKAVHAQRAKISCQLLHAGIRLSTKAFGAGRATRCVGPSAVQFITSGATPHALTVEEINTIVQAYGEAALRARKAGYDLVDVHAGHGYLPHSFLSPFFNKRLDAYGGTIEKRARFIADIIRSIKKTAGDDFPVNVRINAMDKVNSGIDLEQAEVHAKLIEKAGADAVNISVGIRETRHHMIPGSFLPQGCYADYAARIKSKVHIPVMSVGRYTHPAVANKVLAAEKADFIIMGRALLADPELPKKARGGRTEDIRRCIGCNTGCAARDAKKFPEISCAVNAAAGRESVYRIQPASVSKQVMVVGAGPGGMEAARVAALRGHRTVIYEKNQRFGGQLVWAALTQHNRDIKHLIHFLTRQVAALGVECHTGVTVTPELIARKNPDVVVLATGAVPGRPDVPGIDGAHVVFAADVISGKADVGKRVVVVGGGLVGMETSLALAEAGKRVTLIEMQPKIGIGANSLELLALMERFIALDVRVFTNTRLTSVEEDCVAVTMINLTNEHELLSIPANTVVLATGYRSENDLSRHLFNSNRDVRVVGDCVEPRKIIDAIHEGNRAGLEI